MAFAKLADMYYRNQPDKWIGHLRKLRLDTLTGVDITASSGRPIIIKPSSKFWHPTAIPYMAHGYSELVAPLHMLMVYNAVANKGKMMRPYLVSAVQDYGVTVKRSNLKLWLKRFVQIVPWHRYRNVYGRLSTASMVPDAKC